jgi:acetyltransferase
MTVDRDDPIHGACRYPSQWEQHLVLADGCRIFVRPIRPSDEQLVYELLKAVSREDLRLRFFESIKEFTHPFLAGLTQLDYALAMALVAVDEADGNPLGMVRIYADPLHGTGEYAILLRSDHKGRGLGWALMQMIIEYAKSRGLKAVVGQVLQENAAMLKMCRELGFSIRTCAEDRGLCDVTLALDPCSSTALRCPPACLDRDRPARR